MTGHSCQHCLLAIALIPDYDADAPLRWHHVESRDYRCSLFAEPTTTLPTGTRVTWHTLAGDPRWGEIVRPDWQRDLHNKWQPCYRVIGETGVEHLVGADEIEVA